MWMRCKQTICETLGGVSKNGIIMGPRNANASIYCDLKEGKIW